MKKIKNQRFKFWALESLRELGPATWPEMKAWMYENVRGAGRMIPTSGQVGGILGHMPEIEQHHSRKTRRVHHSSVVSTGAYAVWSLRESAM